MSDLTSALREATGVPPGCTADEPELISAPDVRRLLGRGANLVLRDLPGFPRFYKKGVGGNYRRPTMYRRADVEAWKVEYDATRLSRRELSVHANQKHIEARAAARASARGKIGLPSEFDVVRSLRRDLFDEEPLTEAPAPCGHWRVLLSEAGESADGRDVSPKVLARERECDRQHHPRTRLSVVKRSEDPGQRPVGHHPDVVRPRPEDIESASRVPAPGRRGPTVQRITLAGPVLRPPGTGFQPGVRT